MAKKKEPKKSTEPVFSSEEIAELIESFLAIDGPDKRYLKRLYAKATFRRN
jgi:hypothetical protein